MTTHPFTTWFTDYFKPAVEAQCSDQKKKRLLSKLLLFIDNISGHPRALMEMCNYMNVVFIPANIISILKAMDEGVILTFKSLPLKKYILQVYSCH